MFLIDGLAQDYSEKPSEEKHYPQVLLPPPPIFSFCYSHSKYLLSLFHCISKNLKKKSSKHFITHQLWNIYHPYKILSVKLMEVLEWSISNFQLVSLLSWGSIRFQPPQNLLKCLTLGFLAGFVKVWVVTFSVVMFRWNAQRWSPPIQRQWCTV